MGVQRLFYETAKKIEKPVKEDYDLLRAVGIREGPFFKATGGLHAVVVYAYKKGGERIVVKFKAGKCPEHPPVILGYLRKKGFCVLNSFNYVDISEKKLAYKKVPVAYYEKEDWLGYDFSIRIEAASKLLGECGCNLNSEKGRVAGDILLQVGGACGKALEKLRLREFVYKEFVPANLAGEEEACFFDFDIKIDYGKPGAHFWYSKDYNEYLGMGKDFFEKTKLYLPSENTNIKETVFLLLKRGFLNGLKSSKTKGEFIEKVNKNISKWG